MNSEKTKLINDEMSGIIIDTAERIVTTYGVDKLNVRKILKELDITNRVFYNRFHNINEVLQIVYKNTVLKIRETMPEKFEASTKEEFCERAMEIVIRSLENSYEHKMKFNHFVFESDSLSKENSRWWCDKIKSLLDYAKTKGFIADLDSDILSYTIWCFVRGYNADAVARNLPKEEAVEVFKYGFSVYLKGLTM